MTEFEQVLRELHTLRNEVEQILSLLKPKKCSAADRELLGKLLPAVGGAFGSSPVAVREILADPGIRGVMPGSPGAVGGLLSRCASDGAIIAGLQVQRVKREHGATLWMVTRTLPEGIDAAGQRRENDS